MCSLPGVHADATVCRVTCRDARRAADPPEIPLTLQVTVVSAEFETIAVKESVPPRSTVPRPGVTLTLIEGGGSGGGVPEPAPPPAAAQSPRIGHEEINSQQEFGQHRR